MTTTTLTDWRYSEVRMETRQQALKLLLARYGSELDKEGKPVEANQKLYECAHDWVSAGNVNCNGLLKYYEVYYK